MNINLRKEYNAKFINEMDLFNSFKMPNISNNS